MPGMMKACEGQDRIVKKSKFTEDQIAFALKQAELGTSLEEVCRKLGISQRRSACGRRSTQVSRHRCLGALRRREEEYRKLKQIVAHLILDKAMPQAVVARKGA